MGQLVEMETSLLSAHGYGVLHYTLGVNKSRSLYHLFLPT